MADSAERDDVRAFYFELPDGTRYYCPAATIAEGAITPIPGCNWRAIPPATMR